MNRIQDTDKIWSKEAEAATLGSMIIDPKCIGQILPVIDAKSFFLEEHQTIFGALISLYLDNVAIDAIILRTKLKQLNELDKVGGVEYIGKLMDSVASSANAIYYADVVRDRKHYRDINRAIEKIRKVPDEPIEVSEMVEKIQSLALGMEQTQPQEYLTFEDDAERIENEQDGGASYIPTGIRNIDNIISGFGRGELIIVAGRPESGKSALSLQIAMNISRRGLAIVFFTLEMPGRSLIQRALRQESASSLKKLDIILYGNADTPSKQAAFIKLRKQTHKVDVIVVDYLQLMNAGGKSENRVQEITSISRNLKLAAVAEDIPIIALSQLNREVTNRENHRPRLSDLRESGAIEQDADIVMLLHREDVYRRVENPGAEQDGRVEVIIAKSRRGRKGRTGIAELVFIDEQVKFENLLHGADYYG